MAAPGTTVGAFLGDLRALMAAIPTSAVPVAERFWRRLRTALVDQERAVDELRRELEALSAGQGISRPRSTESVLNLRAALAESMMLEAAISEEASDATAGLLRISPAWALNYLESIRVVPTADNTHPLDCWATTRGSRSPKGYVKLNLRNTKINGVPAGISPFAHQLAVVASGEESRNLLALTTLAANAGERERERCEVSHLCHNPGCFNPSHVCVEPHSINAARNICHGSAIFVAPDGTTFDPCPHHEGGRRRCILRTFRAQAQDRGKWFQMTSTQGPQIRRA